MKPSEELEAQVTALLLGELSPDEAAAMRDAIAKDPELARLHDRLKQTIGLVREAAVSPAHDAHAGGEALKLSAERSEQLLAVFKTSRPRELPKAARSNAPRRELLALAAMIVALFAVSALMFRAPAARENSQLPASSFAQWKENGEDFIAREPEQLNGENAVRELRATETPLVPPVDPATGLPSSPSVRYRELSSYFVAADPAKAPKRVADLPPPSVPASETPSLALALPAVPPAAQPPSVSDEFKSIPARRSNIALPVVEDSLAAVAEGEINRQLTRTDFVERQSGVTSDGRQADQFGSTTGQGSGGRGGGLKPAAGGTGPAEPQMNRRFTGAEYAGVSGAGSGLAPAPGAAPLPALQKPTSQSLWAANLDGIQPKDSDSASAVALTNAIVVGAKFADITTPLNDDFFVSDLGGFAGRNLQSLEKRNEPLNQSQFGNAPMDALGDSQRSALGRDASGSVNRFYSFSGVANGQAVIDQKREADYDTMKRDGKLAELSDDKKLDVVTRGTPLAFNVQTGKPVSDPRPEAGQKSAEAARPEVADAFAKKRAQLALPKGERAEVQEKLQIASGPVIQSEIVRSPESVSSSSFQGRLGEIVNRAASGTADALSPIDVPNRPAPARGDDLAVTIDESRRSLGRQLATIDEVKLKQVLAGHDQPTGTVDREANVVQEVAKLEKRNLEQRELLDRRKKVAEPESNHPTPTPTAPILQPELLTADNAFSTFSLNVSDVSFKLAAASLEKGQMPDPATVRSEEFINAFDYRDPEPKGSAPVAFAWERARYPFAHDRELVRLSVKTAASGRQPGRPLNLVLLLDNSGSMERADRLRIRQECLRVLAGQLRPEDRVSVVAFARTARLWVDGLPGAQAGELAQRVGSLTPEGGTNLEDAMNLAYQTALRHFQANGVNRVVLLTDGAANLGDVQPESLKKKVEDNRRQGIALDCFGLGWDGYNDDLLEVLSRNGDGRYGFINTPEAAASDFAGQLAGALEVAASDVKVQVEWNPRRVTAYRQIGYAKHQLEKEQFRDNTVDAAEIGAAEAGNALYVVQVDPRGEGPLGTMRVRFKVPGTADYREHEWPLAYDGAAKPLDNSSPALRLAASASAFSEWLVSSPYAAEVTPDRLLGFLSGVPEQSPADPRPKKLEWMIRQAKSLSGK